MVRVVRNASAMTGSSPTSASINLRRAFASFSFLSSTASPVVAASSALVADAPVDLGIFEVVWLRRTAGVFMVVAAALGGAAFIGGGEFPAIVFISATGGGAGVGAGTVSVGA